MYRPRYYPWRRRRYYRRYDQLTGGTKDVCPQFYRGTIVQDDVDQTTSKSLTLPVTRIPNTRRPTIIEVLKIEAVTNVPIYYSDNADQYVKIIFGTRDLGSTDSNIDDLGVMCVLQADLYTNAGGAFTPTTRLEYNFSDGAGHGFLVGVDTLYVQIRSAATGVQQNWSFRIYYRFKSVTTSDMMGVVVSQT